MGVLGLHHAGVYVSSLERSVAFYRQLFGLDVVERLTFGDEELVFLKVGPARIELIEVAAVARSASGVVDHVALEVRDLDALLDELKARGVTLLDATPVPVPSLKARTAFCLGPDGERIELFEYTRAGQ